MIKQLTVTVFFCFAATTSLVAEDLIAHIQTETNKDGKKEKTKAEIYISGKNVKVIPNDNSGYFIFKGEKQLLVLVDEEKETYTEIDEKTIQKIKTTVEQVRKQLDNMPAEQRKMAKDMMQQKLQQKGVSLEKKKADFSYKQTGETKDINTYPCRKVQVQKDSETIETLWITDWDNVKRKEELQTAYGAIVDFVNSFRDLFHENLYRKYMQIPFMPSDLDEEFEGLPISTLHYGNNNQVIRKTMLQKIETKTLPADTFHPPEGYESKRPEFPE